MRIIFYILFMILTAMLIGFSYLLLTDVDSNAGWLTDSFVASGLIITAIIFIKIFQRFMKTPVGKEQH